MPKKIDLSGQKYGRLTVTREGPKTFTSGGNSIVQWYCDCDCGAKDVLVRANDLRTGHTQSCGCFNRERNRASKFRTCNTYDLSGQFGVGYTSKGEPFWFDLEDYELIKQYNWFVHRNYIVAHMPMTNPRQQIYMHRLVMGMQDVVYNYDIDVDHIKTEHKFDNRKSNLRVVTKAENTKNHRLQKNNTSGVSGVHYDKDKGRWRTSINIDGKRKCFTCVTYEDAVRLRYALEDKYYGDFSYRKSQELANHNQKKEVV